MHPIRLVAVALLVSLAADPASVQAQPVIAANSITGTRDARYCEIIPIMREGFHLRATVYNTLGLNDCPPALWDAITEEAMRRRFDALTVLLNGPRHFLMDSISAQGATKEGEKIEAGGLELTERATIDLGLLDLLHRPYREQSINRDTIYTFKAGSPVFMLEAPNGSRYAMQAYAQIVDKLLDYAALPTLGARLNLPSGLALFIDSAGTRPRAGRGRQGHHHAGRTREHLSEARLIAITRTALGAMSGRSLR